MFPLEHALKFFEYMLKDPITMPKANKFYVEWSLSGQNRFVNMGYKTLQATARKLLALSPSAPMLYFYEGGQRLAYIEWNRMPCVPSKSVGNFLR